MEATEHTNGAKRPLPEGWRWVRLGEVCEINPRKTDISRPDIEPTSFVPMEAVDAEKGMICEVRERPFADVKKGYTYFEEGDVLFAKITPCMQNGKHAIARNLIEGIGFASTEFHVIRPAKGILAEWIHHFVRQPAVLHDATNHFTGAVGQKRVPDDFLKSLGIPLPPIEEQRRIAGVLREQMAAVEKARTAAQARLEAVKTLPASLLRQVFPQPGQPLPDGWRWVRLGEVCEINPRRNDIIRPDIEPTSFVPMEAVDAEKGMICEVRERPFADVKKGYTYFEEGDVLFAKITPCMQNGKHAIARNLIEGIGFASTEFHVIRPAKGILAEWIHHFVRQPAVLHDATNHFTGAVGQQRVPDDFLKSLEIPLPPLDEQRRIAGVLREQMAAVAKARASAEEELQTISALPAALLCRAFNGEL
jgi:type I restriction enzyme S subunit